MVSGAKAFSRPVIAIIDIDLCNLRSISRAVDETGHDFKLVSRPTELHDPTQCILPGVGSFRTAMERLDQSGLTEAVRTFAASGRPLLGICLGMQVLARMGEEGGRRGALGLIDGEVTRMEAPGLRLPHIGWNTVTLTRPHPLFAGVKPSRDFYFVHSYHLRPQDPAAVLAETEYGTSFVSAVAWKNIVGLQFHPEKSQANGLRLLSNFCGWDGRC